MNSWCCTGNDKFQAEKISNTQKMGRIGREWQVTAEKGSRNCFDLRKHFRNKTSDL